MKRKFDFKYIKHIKANFKIVFLNHFTRIENLNNILKCRMLIAKARLNRGDYYDISDPKIQSARENIKVLDSGKNLSEFVPLYFCVASPMISRLRKHNKDIIYLQFALDLLKNDGIFITDGNARNNSTIFYKFKGVETLSNLDVKAINTRNYALNEETKRKKQAEALIPEKVELSYLYNIACFGEHAKSQVVQILDGFGLKNAVKISESKHFYYD